MLLINNKCIIFISEEDICFGQFVFCIQIQLFYKQININNQYKGLQHHAFPLIPLLHIPVRFHSKFEW